MQVFDINKVLFCKKTHPGVSKTADLVLLDWINCLGSRSSARTPLVFPRLSSYYNNDICRSGLVSAYTPRHYLETLEELTRRGAFISLVGESSWLGTSCVVDVSRGTFQSAVLDAVDDPATLVSWQQVSTSHHVHVRTADDRRQTVHLPSVDRHIRHVMLVVSCYQNSDRPTRLRLFKWYLKVKSRRLYCVRYSIVTVCDC